MPEISDRGLRCPNAWLDSPASMNVGSATLL